MKDNPHAIAVGLVGCAVIGSWLLVALPFVPGPIPHGAV